MPIRGKLISQGEEHHFTLPGSWNLLAQAEPRDVPAVADLRAGLRRALENPIGTRSLAKLVPGSGHVAIISEDQTRPSPVAGVIGPLVEMLTELGVDDGRIKVIIGGGVHRKATPEEVKAKLGASIVNRFTVTVHDCDDRENLVLMGRTGRDTPVWINRAVAEAGLKIGIGTCNPHYFAGYGGGAKLILPGVAGRESIVHNHTMCGHLKATQGVTEGNPIWEDMLEAARMAGLDVKIDLVLNTRKEVHEIFAGEMEQVQREAIKKLLTIYGQSVPRMADISLTSGYPLETDLIQSGKAILLANEVTKDGGAIVLMAALTDGAGPKLYQTLKQKPDPETVLEWIREGRTEPTGGPLASMLRKLLETKRIIVVTAGLTGKQVEDMEMEHASTIEEAIEILAKDYQNPDVIISPVGGSTFPYVG